MTLATLILLTHAHACQPAIQRTAWQSTAGARCDESMGTVQRRKTEERT